MFKNKVSIFYYSVELIDTTNNNPLSSSSGTFGITIPVNETDQISGYNGINSFLHGDLMKELVESHNLDSGNNLAIADVYLKVLTLSKVN